MINFSLDEVFKMACEVEDDGREFYLKAAEHAGTDETRKLFAELADWELRHKKLFQSMRDSLPEKQRTEYFDPENEAARYLHGFVEGKVFNLDPSVIDSLAHMETPDVLRRAIEIEKDSIAFYTGVRQVVPKDAQRVDDIITEEQRHVRILSDLLPDEQKG